MALDEAGTEEKPVGAVRTTSVTVRPETLELLRRARGWISWSTGKQHTNDEVLAQVLVEFLERVKQ